MRPLGRAQLECMGHLDKSLSKRWGINWHGWVWDSPSRTQSIFESLHRRGLVDYDGYGFELNDAGRKVLREWRKF